MDQIFSTHESALLLWLNLHFCRITESPCFTKSMTNCFSFINYLFVINSYWTNFQHFNISSILVSQTSKLSTANCSGTWITDGVMWLSYTNANTYKKSIIQFFQFLMPLALNHKIISKICTCDLNCNKTSVFFAQ